MQDWQSELAAGQIKPVYLFYGAERFLLQKALAQVIAAVAPGANPFNLTRLNAETAGLTELLGHANTLPFFTERKLIVVDNCPWFANRKKAAEGEETESAEPDLQELLAYLQETGRRIAMASSSTRDRALNLLDQHGVTGYFQRFVFAGEVERGKPAPDVFLKACEKLGEPPEDCLVLEDSEAGIQAAHAARIPVICVPDLKTPERRFLDLTAAVCPSLDQVIPYLSDKKG